MSEQAKAEAEAREHPEYWNVRGIGKDYDLPCLVTGEPQELCSNISGFVASRAAGERVVALFGGRGRLDYREHEPNWVQVKVGVSAGHEAVLERLMEGVLALEGMIDKRIIAWAVNPDKSPGYKPRILERAAVAEQERDEALALGRRIVCSYCGETREKKTLPEETVDEMIAHMESCPAHPFKQAADAVVTANDIASELAVALQKARDYVKQRSRGGAPVLSLLVLFDAALSKHQQLQGRKS